ncbi:MAG: hypothetical protein V3V15_03705 [Sphingorhabdus sp.]
MEKLEMKKLLPSLLVISTGLLFLPAAHASEIGSGSIVKKTHDLHETITRLAETCLAENTEIDLDCARYLEQVKDRSKTKATTRRGSLAHASRWPDDPTRKLHKDFRNLSFGLKMLGGCRQSFRYGQNIDDAGLQCVSHFGKLQFLHAQSSVPNRDSTETRKEILAWARLAFRVATNPEYGANESYCDTVHGLSGDLEVLKGPLSLSSRRSCESQRSAPRWTIRSFFSLQCGKEFSSARCRDLSISADKNIARRAATGSILHMVQDSYSQSHAARVAQDEEAPAPTGPFEAVFACKPIKKFYSYGNQTSATHGVADVPPKKSDPGCTAPNRSVHDVITASAKVIWFVTNTTGANRGQMEDKLVRYLEDRVFNLSK